MTTDRPDPSLGRLIERLSALLSTEEGARTLASMQRLGLLASRGDASAATPARDDSLRFGIWEPERNEDGTVDFVRNPALITQWRFWAEMDRIRPKRGPRVLLLGESVARGYLYDPAVTPASVLAAMLQTASGLEDVEVVDLARTDLGVDELRTMLDLLPALEPDAVVLFAGNNWHNVPFRIENLQELADALRADGYAGMRRVVVERVVLPRVQTMLEELAESLKPFSIPAAVVIPEFNLRDWRSEPQVLVPVLPGQGNVTWLRARQEAERALVEGDLQRVEHLADSMIGLDEGTSAVSHNLRAEALLGLGRREEARGALEAARDAPYGLMIAHAPRCPAAMQKALDATAAEHGFAVVDLPRLLAARNIIPDRRFFLDYCHLTIEGMRIAMAATAETVMGLMDVAAPPVRDMEAVEIAVTPTDEALAHLLAAIHNAHWGQPLEIVRHHCARAARLAPEAAGALLAYADAESRRAAPWLCASFDELSQIPNARRYLGVDEAWMFEKLADFELVEAVVDALEASGTPARTRIAEILSAEHGHHANVDLLEPRYRATTFRERAGYSLGAERAYHRALDIVSRFYLVRAEPEPMVLRLTCRIPSGEGELAVVVNGSRVDTLAVDGMWHSHSILVEARVLCTGLNRIELEWPLLAPTPDLREHDARRIERGAYPVVLPAFGEIHTFTAARPDVPASPPSSRRVDARS